MKHLKRFTTIIVIGFLFLQCGFVHGQNLNDLSTQKHTTMQPPSITEGLDYTGDEINLKARYIYDTDTDTADLVTDILTNQEFDVELIHISTIREYTWSDTGLVVIGPDTGSGGTWTGTEVDVELLRQDYKQFLSIGEGGLSFQQQIPELQVNWKNSTEESTTGIQSETEKDNLWIFPHLLPQNHTIYQWKSKVYTVPAQESDLPFSVHGRINTGNAVLTYENDQFYCVGIQDASIWMDGTMELMENVIAFLRYQGVPVSSGITGSNDLVYEEGITGNVIQWTFNHLLLQNYTIYQDKEETVISTTSSANTIIYSVDDLSEGEYNFTILLFDALGLSYMDWIMVTVTPFYPDPAITSVPDFSYWYGEQGRNITWYCYDDNPASYEIYRNGTPVQSDDWVDGIPIIYQFNELGHGLYNFTLLVSDLSGQFVTDTVYVTVLLDTDEPELTIIGNFTMEEDAEDKTIQWSAVDIFPSRYNILNGSATLVQGYWNSHEMYSIDFTNFTLGKYNITFVISDAMGNLNSRSITVEIVDKTSPLIIGETQIYTVPGASDVIYWVLNDNHPDNFTVYLDGNRYINGSWTELPFVDISLSALTYGVYNFTIIVQDTSGNQATHMVRVYIDLSYATETEVEGGGSGTDPLFDIQIEYVIGAGFVAVIGVGVSLLRRRSG